ncbi:hypothetical protein SAMD00019534_017740 [Acytostelium subglobosum LB1]|uniref:hypothetical protein n=1 Tax=Acytostelium subglobosum LB1 TaxID=1410327 RepID=UPI000644B461|nr:hypothetical protein SAMD00019534_017740 [Acytostelium subglobosum LB1]GAM18599.1 hypothetical protein SAMD00019534_017740 [Acytostelium subglobosum LB1]|eukprot:XP_012757819.1 hypothetical protein SAMD00019534_017740 [Acytostelium subglobosum LB1]
MLSINQQQQEKANLRQPDDGGDKHLDDHVIVLGSSGDSKDEANGFQITGSESSDNIATHSGWNYDDDEVNKPKQHRPATASTDIDQLLKQGFQIDDQDPGNSKGNLMNDQPLKNDNDVGEPGSDQEDPLLAILRAYRPGPGRPKRSDFATARQASHKEKIERQRLNDREQKILYDKVRREYRLEKIAVLTKELDDEGWIKRFGYAAVPKLPDYSPPPASQWPALFSDTAWKSDPALNPYCLPRPLIFIHIPKTGGTSLVDIFELNANNTLYHNVVHPPIQDIPRVMNSSVLFGHFHFGLHHYFHEADPIAIPDRPDGLNKYSYLTMFREPVERVISHYYFLRDSKTHPLHASAMRYNITEWMVRQPAADNEQTRRLLGSSRQVPFREDALEIAMHHLKYSIKFVGLTERFDESMVMLSYYTGFEHVMPVRKNVGRAKSKIEVSETTKNTIRKLNWMDVIIYERAKEIFELQLDAIGRDYIQAELNFILEHNVNNNNSDNSDTNNQEIVITTDDNNTDNTDDNNSTDDTDDNTELNTLSP